MAADYEDLIQIVDNQLYLNDPIMNVYYYRVTSLTGLSDPYLDAIADWFVTNVVTPVTAIQNNQLIHTNLEVRNLSNNLDVHTEVVNAVGLIAATAASAMSGFTTVNFKLIRESLATRHGSKRYSGLVEGNASGNTYNMGATEQANIEAALAADIVLGVVTVAEPVIVRRPIDPPVGDTYIYSSIGSAAYTRYGTQNTRKV